MSETNNETNVDVVAEDTQTQEVQASESSASVNLKGFFGFKRGMSAIYNDKGERVPVTVLECKPWTITQIKTQEKDGYTAVQISGEPKKAKNSLKSELGHVKKAGLDSAPRHSGEIRQELPEGVAVGQKVTVASFEKGQTVKVTATSKGKGFSGVMKRYGFGGGPASHGSGFHRKPGSIGNREFPGRVQPGKKMAGQHGNRPMTVKGLEVVDVIPEKNVLLLKGSVPGATNSLVKIVKL